MHTKADLEYERDMLQTMRNDLLSKQDATPKGSRHLFDARLKVLETARARVDLLLSIPGPDLIDAVLRLKWVVRDLGDWKKFFKYTKTKGFEGEEVPRIEALIASLNKVVKLVERAPDPCPTCRGHGWYVHQMTQRETTCTCPAGDALQKP